ncbi:MAG: hypothetical protein FJW39_32445 [Acidobacteria bacterium]|nr:hypothetical protein [Acidobacteriota bacterium]
MTWLIIGFAWMAWAGVSQVPWWPALARRGLVLVLLIPVMAAKFAFDARAERRHEQAVRRVAVEGRARMATVDSVISGFTARKVRVIDPDGVRLYLTQQSLGYCEYEWNHQKLRGVTEAPLPEGQPCRGLLNVADPLDVKWEYR